MYKKIISAVLCMAMMFSFTACGEDTGTKTTASSNDSISLGANKDDSSESAEEQKTEKAETSSDEVINFTMPVEGEQIAVFDIEGYGQIKIKLFPEQCPKGVENFTGLIEKGYYDGVIFHRVIKDFMIQGGDGDGSPDGVGGESIWGKGFAQEINDSLRHFSGALSYATAMDKLNGSQFFIVTGFESVPEQHFENLQSQNNKTYSDNVKKLYGEKGGYPFLDGDYEVFGQVFEGLDICFKISEVATNDSDKPLEDVVINYAKLEGYKPE